MPVRSARSRWRRGNMNVLRWIWAYLFDCVHSHTTWPHQNQFGHAYVCCLDCGREMAYSLEYMRIVEESRTRNTWNLRFPATASLVIAGALLLLTPSYAVAETAQSLVCHVQRGLANRNIAPTLVMGFVGGFPPFGSSACPAFAENHSGSCSWFVILLSI